MGGILHDASPSSLRRPCRHVGIFGFLGLGDCQHDRRESFERAQADLYLQFHSVGYYLVRLLFLSLVFFNEFDNAFALKREGEKFDPN